MSDEGQSDQFNGRLGLIFASIGAAIGTGNIWRFPRMVGANGGGTFLVPWLIFLFAWSIPLVIAEYAMGKRSRTGTIGTFRIFAGKKFAWMGLWTAWISTAIGFYYAVVSGWTIKYFQLGISGALTGEGVIQLKSGTLSCNLQAQVIFFQFLVIVLTLAAIWKGAKAIEKVNFYLMISLFRSALPHPCSFRFGWIWKTAASTELCSCSQLTLQCSKNLKYGSMAYRNQPGLVLLEWVCASPTRFT